MSRTGLIAAVSLLVAACHGASGSDAGYDDPALAARRREVVVRVADLVVEDLDAFVEVAGALETATAAYAASRTPTTREAAQTAWTDAMAVWERLEIAMVGPGAMANFSGGLSIRDEIYSFPIINTCRVDQELIAQSYADPDALAEELVHVRGLGAMEYLLFAPNAENTCGPTIVINTDGSWAALSAAEIEARRADYAHSLAVLIAREAQRLRTAWGNRDVGFLHEMTTAGDGSELFASTRVVLNELTGALLYVDTMMKEMKIGEPAGIIVCTTGPACLVELESRWSTSSKEHALDNLRAFRRVVIGDGDEPGFDDMLRDIGQGALADDLASSIEASIARVEQLEGTLEEAITNDPASVMSAYETLGEMLSLFKVDVIGALDIEVTVIPRDQD